MENANAKMDEQKAFEEYVANRTPEDIRDEIQEKRQVSNPFMPPMVALPFLAKLSSKEQSELIRETVVWLSQLSVPLLADALSQTEGMARLAYQELEKVRNAYLMYQSQNDALYDALIEKGILKAEEVEKSYKEVFDRRANDLYGRLEKKFEAANQWVAKMEEAEGKLGMASPENPLPPPRLPSPEEMENDPYLEPPSIGQGMNP